MKFWFLIIFITITSLTYAADVEDSTCSDFIKENELQIKTKVQKDGYSFISECEGKNPYIFLAIVDLDRDDLEINTTLSPIVGKIKREKTEDGYDSPYFERIGNKLTTITEHSKRKNALIAVNGFTWGGDIGGISPRLQYGIASSTLFSRGLNKGITIEKEIQLGFSKRTEDGTKSKSAIQNNGSIGVGEEFYNTIVSSTTSYLVNGVNKNSSNIPMGYTRWSGIGIGSKWGRNVLVIISSSSSYLKLLKTHNDFVKVFKSLGVKNALRLDGNSAAAIAYNGEHLNKLPLKLRYVTHENYGTARKILYAITVSKKPPFSKPQFENAGLASKASINEIVSFSGKVTSNKTISEIVIATTKPDGVVVVETTQNLNSRTIDLSNYKFNPDGDFNQIGNYHVSIIARDSNGSESTKVLNIEVLPKVDSVSVDPNSVEVGKKFKLSVYGKKLTTDVKAYVVGGTECSVATPTDEISVEFDCVAPSPAGKYTWVVYYKDKSKSDYELDKKEITVVAPIECTAGQTEPRSCPITNGSGTQSRTCSSGGQWGGYSNCSISSCNSGYHQDNGSCVVNTPNQNCTPNDTQSQACTITNGAGIQTRTCSADGSDWGNYGSCIVDSCDNGYHVENNLCVVNPPTQACTPSSTESQSCSITNGTGSQSRTCSSDGLSWGNYESCQVASCDTGYNKSGNRCVANTVVIPVPINLVAVPKSSMVTIGWLAIDNADSYQYDLIDRDGSDDRDDVVTTANALNVFNLTPEHRYKFRVRAKVGNDFGGYSSYEYFTTEAINIPSNLQTANGLPHHVTMAWDLGNEDNGYNHVLEKISGGSWARDITTTSLRYENLLFGHDYRFKVRTKVGSNYGEYSSYKNFTVYCPLDKFSGNSISDYIYNYTQDGLNSKTQVKELQGFLKYLGYSVGTVDGKFGGNTETALKAYQVAEGITASGKTDTTTRSKINATCD